VFPQLFGKYVLEREIAAGGMARVYLATLRGAVGFEKRLVVKQIRPELASDEGFVSRFVSEAKTAVGLSHPNIVPVYELGVEQGVYYIAMELCPGLTLYELLQTTGKLSPAEGAYVGVEICRALDYAHRKAKIVHRDVTPRNVLIDEEGAVRLIDFGIAAVVSGDAHEVFGSPGHMPPEQLAGSSLTPATDVFAVSALLVEAWTGRAPFRRENAHESRRAMAEPVAPLSSTDEELAPVSELIARGLSLDSKARPAEAELLARPLRDFLRSADVGEVARKLGDRVRDATRRNRREPPVTEPVTGASERPSALSSRPPAGDGSQPSGGGTGSLSRTFAAREEVSEWTRRVSEPPPSGTGPHTRKLQSVAPAPSSGARDSAPPSVSAAPAQTSARPSLAAPRTFRARGPQAVALVGAGALIATAVFGGARLIGRDTGETASASARPPASTLRLEPAPAQSSTPPRPIASVPVLPPANLERASSAKPEPSARRAANSALRLTSDPAAKVFVRGAGLSRALTTPVRELKLPPGVYSVSFESATYGAPVTASVSLADGAQRSVHADFREAEPRISVR
jgi:serine/threonine protein kinase